LTDKNKGVSGDQVAGNLSPSRKTNSTPPDMARSDWSGCSESEYGFVGLRIYCYHYFVYRV